MRYAELRELLAAHYATEVARCSTRWLTGFLPKITDGVAAREFVTDPNRGAGPELIAGLMAMDAAEKDRLMRETLAGVVAAELARRSEA